MNDRINKLVQSVMKKNSLDDCSLTELEEMADKHPYFGAAQLLLAKKLQSVDEEKYTKQVEKTALFFHNPLWLDNLLNDAVIPEIKEPVSREPIINDRPENIIQEDHVEINEPVINETAKQEPENDEQDEQPVIKTEWQESSSVELPAAETNQPEITQSESREIITSEPDHAKTGERIEPGVALVPGMSNEISGSPQQETKSEFLFEPFHTVDYFASQGIKIRDEELVKDKLGKQLKSFTEWLKTMKRLPVTELEKKTEAAPDQKVEQLAEHSLQDRQVLTEAMAEVWEKQGNRQKAIEIYNKLSLLEPSKSAYFAAKIEDLKKTS